ncbi:hypothetical protein [Streptomyces sp. LN549]
MPAHLSPLGPLGALPVGCAVRLLTAGVLGQILAPSAHRSGRTA